MIPDRLQYFSNYLLISGASNIFTKSASAGSALITKILQEIQEDRGNILDKYFNISTDWTSEQQILVTTAHQIVWKLCFLFSEFGAQTNWCLRAVKKQKPKYNRGSSTKNGCA